MDKEDELVNGVSVFSMRLNVKDGMVEVRTKRQAFGTKTFPEDLWRINSDLIVLNGKIIVSDMYSVLYDMGLEYVKFKLCEHLENQLKVLDSLKKGSEILTIGDVRRLD